MTNNNSDGPPSTYAERARITDDIRGGRFAALGRPTVIGSGPAAHYQTLPASSPWHSDPVPPEAPLGYAINDLASVGEAHEVAASEASLGSADDPGVPRHAPPVDHADPSPAQRPKIARRRSP